MEEEDKAAQSAKLQELIRRGRPQDLQEANRLMKVMAGYDTRNKTDYRAKAAEEVAKVQEKAKILEEMLQSQRAGDKIEDNDVFAVCTVPAHRTVPADVSRNSPPPCPARIPRYKECARRNRRTMRLWRSCWRSTTAYTARSNATS